MFSSILFPLLQSSHTVRDMTWKLLTNIGEGEARNCKLVVEGGNGANEVEFMSKIKTLERGCSFWLRAI